MPDALAALPFKHDAYQHVLRIAGKEGEVTVASFSGQEALSSLFEYDLTVGASEEHAAGLEETLGAEAVFTVEHGGVVVRRVRGVLASVVPDGATMTQGRRQIGFTLRPRLWELTERRDTRIFQALTVPAIVDALVKDIGIRTKWNLERPSEPREYRTQYNETDYAFLARLLAEEGIHYFFEHTDEETFVVFANHPDGYEKLAGDASLPFREVGGVVFDDHVSAIARRQRVRTGSVTARGYDFRRPRFDLTAGAEIPEPQSAGNSAWRESYEWPEEYADPRGDGTRVARRRLEEKRSDALVLEGKSSSYRLEVGRAFTLKGHSDPSFNGELLVIALTLSGEDARTSEAGVGAHGPAETELRPVTFRAVPADVNVRPRRARARHVPANVTARVTGPEKGQPYLDEFARVKVQFFWDREGKFDEHSSCWLRVATPWAGEGYGFHFPLREGMEVVVSFLNGDPDQPYVHACLYNGVQRPPHAVPEHARRVSIKTQTSPGDEGSNDLYFDDTAGHEEIFLHAQRDRNTVVGHNHSEQVRANQTVSVGANQTESVGANQTVSVAANQTISVAKDRTEVVDGAEKVTVAKGRSHTVTEGGDALHVADGDREVHVYKGNHVRDVKLLDKLDADNIEHHARYDVHVIGDRMVEIRQGDTVIVCKAGNVDVSCPGTLTIKTPHGSLAMAEKKISLAATDELVLACDKARLILKKDGTIEGTAAKEVTVKSGSSLLKLEPKKASVNGAEIDVVAVGTAQLNGALIKIG